jgi:hypothetical protein
MAQAYLVDVVEHMRLSSRKRVTASCEQQARNIAIDGGGVVVAMLSCLVVEEAQLDSGLEATDSEKPLGAGRVMTMSIEPGFLENAKNRKEAEAAIGRLVIWALSSHKENVGYVSIHAESSGEVTALYRDARGGTSYKIVAEPNGDTFLFHS